MNSEFTAGGRCGIYRHRPKAPVGAHDPVNRCLRPVLLPAPDRGMTRCHCLHNTHRLVPPNGSFATVYIWYRFVALPGAYSVVLAPGRATTRYQLPSLGLVEAKGTSCWLQQQPVPLAWTFSPFSSSVVFCKNKTIGAV